MTTFKYKGITYDGANISGVIKAYDEFEAVAQLRDTCSIITKIDEVKEAEHNESGRRIRIKDKELAIMCSQLAIVISSGLPVVRCVEMVSAQAKNKDVKRMLEKTAEDIQSGYTMAQSFEKNSNGGLPITFIETIRAGEQSGTLEACFNRLKKYYDKLSTTRAKIISTLTYPAIVLFVAIIVFIVIMTVAVPMFTEIFEDMGSELPGITRALIATSNFISSYWWAFIAIAAAVYITRLVLLRTTDGKLFLAMNKLKRSPFRKLNIMSASGQFANTMATMLTAGIPITKAIDITSNVVSNYAFGIALRKVKEGVEQGRRIADCMADIDLFPKMLTEMTGVGERSGSMEDTLTVVGEYYDNEVSIITTRFLALLEPAITVGLAIMAVILMFSVYLPMFTMYGSI